MSKRIPCRYCQYYTDPQPYLDDNGRQIGIWTEGRCAAPGTLHPVTYSWNSCHLAKKAKGAR